MKVAQIREAERLLAASNADDRDVVSLAEMGEPGCLLRLGDPTARHLGWREWIIEGDGSSSTPHACKGSNRAEKTLVAEAVDG